MSIIRFVDTIIVSTLRRNLDDQPLIVQAALGGGVRESERFAPLSALSDAELAAEGAVRRIADARCYAARVECA